MGAAKTVSFCGATGEGRQSRYFDDVVARSCLRSVSQISAAALSSLTGLRIVSCRDGSTRIQG
jgi:hypothetical protein